jgi:hypothetical protein
MHNSTMPTAAATAAPSTAVNAEKNDHKMVVPTVAVEEAPKKDRRYGGEGEGEGMLIAYYWKSAKK